MSHSGGVLCLVLMMALIIIGCGPAFASGETVSLNIGKIPPGASITITFDEVVDRSMAAVKNQVSNQGSVSGSNFSTIQTDDPDSSAMPKPQPTITPVVNIPPTAGFGKALSLDGVDRYVEAPDSGGLSTPAYTLEAWVMFGAVNACSVIFRTDAGGVNYSNAISLDSAGHFVHTAFDGSYHTVTGTTTVQAGRWYHVAAVFGGGTMRLYVDGMEEGSPVSGLGTIWSSGDRYEIGRSHASLGAFLNGQVDEVRIWDAALSAAGINAWMFRYIDETAQGSDNLAAYYKFDEGAGTVAEDSTGGFDASLINIPEAGWTDSSVTEWYMNEDDVLPGRLVGSDEDGTSTDGVNWSSAITFEIRSQGTKGVVALGTGNEFTYTPDPDQNGDDTFTYRVYDGAAYTADRTVVIHIIAVNDGPTISPVPLSDLTISENGATGAINVTIGDTETAADSLSLTAASSDTTLVPVSNIVFSGSGTDRSLIVTPAANRFGTATITVTVGDGGLTASTSFLLTVTQNTYTLAGQASPAAGGTVNCPATALSGTAPNCPVTANTGYHITGVSGCWGTPYTAPSTSVTAYDYTTGPLTGNCTVTASFALNRYTVSASAGAGGSLDPSTPSPVTADHGSPVTFIFNASSTYHIAGVSNTCGTAPYTNTSNSVSSYTFTVPAIAGDCTVSATFSINRYTVSASAGAGGSLDPSTPSPVAADHGSAVSFTFNADSGYHIAGISDTCGSAPYSNSSNAVSGHTFATTGITADCAVSATFALNRYNVTFQTDGHGMVIGPSSQTISHGGNTTIVVAIADSGYSFTNWTGTGGFSATSSNPLIVTNVTSDMTVTANFGGLFTVTMDVSNGGIACSPTSVAAGGGSSCSFAANTGFYAANLTDNLTAIPDPVSPYDIVNIQEDHHVALECREYYVQRHAGATTYLPYMTIQGAVNDISAAVELLTIKEVSLTEAVLLDRPALIMIEGGYNIDFSDNTGGFTTLNGSLTVGDGTVEISNIIIR